MAHSKNAKSQKGLVGPLGVKKTKENHFHL